MPAPANQSAAPNKPLLVGVVVGVLVIASIAFVAANGGSDDGAPDAVDPDAPIEYGIVRTSGTPLVPLPEGDDPAVGAVAPGVISERAEGEVRITPGEDDEPTMVVFLAHWCPHCQRELPLLVGLADAGAFDDIRTVAVLTSTTPTRDNYPPSAWLDREGWTGDRLFDDDESQVATAYGLSSFPMMVFLDADGRVTSRLSGEQPAEAIQAAVAQATA